MTVLTATLSLRGGAAFEATAGSGHSVVLDSPEVTGGGNAGFRPLEMLLIGVGGCAGMVAGGLLRRMGQKVDSYELRLAGTRAESHPMVLTEITVEHRLSGAELDPAMVSRAIAAATAQYSPVVIMVAKSAKLAHTFVVKDTASGLESSGSL